MIRLNEGLLLSTGKKNIFYVSSQNYFSFEFHFFLNIKLGKKWHDRRKILTPAFHFKILEQFAEVFDRLGNSFIDKLYELNADKGIEFFHVAARYALDVISREFINQLQVQFNFFFI